MTDQSKKDFLVIVQVAHLKYFLAVLTTLVTRCSELRELDLSDCNMLSSDSIKILTRLQNLEYVSLSRCYKMSNQSYL